MLFIRIKSWIYCVLFNRRESKKALLNLWNPYINWKNSNGLSFRQRGFFFSTVWKRKEYRTEGLLRKQDKTPVVYDKKASLPIMLNLQKNDPPANRYQQHRSLENRFSICISYLLFYAVYEVLFSCSINTARTAISAGFTPEIRDACPIVKG